MSRRWLFADQLGPHFLDERRQPVLLIESKAVFRRRAFHRQKAHLLLSALRHRAAELGDQAIFLRTETYGEALRRVPGPLEVCHPTSRSALRFVRGLDRVAVLPPRGFVTTIDDFAEWADGRRGALRFDAFYRFARQRHRVLLDGDEPVGGRWSPDPGNRGPRPKGVRRLDVPPPPVPTEDDIDAEVRADLDRWEREGVRFVGRDGPRRFPATAAEAKARLRHFLRHRLAHFGPYEGVMLAADPWLAHSLLSTSLNLGLLDPMEAVRGAEQAYRRQGAPLSSVEGFIRRILGWRDFVWNLYWYVEPDHLGGDRLAVRRPVPDWFRDLDADAVRARCLSDVLAEVRDHGWVHHVARLMVLGNYGRQRGWRPAEMVDFFHRSFVDGFVWAMTVNVAGPSQYADLGRTATTPYAAGGSPIDRASDYCGGCRYDPGQRLGGNGCPYTAGHVAFLARNRDRLPPDARTARQLAQLDRLPDVDEVVAQEERRGADPP
ncbi:cryptochrome/photolyase family protein [Micromonospora globbae]|uniref:Cryptochrome/photolyase family protein n=1 Tax=Micromonospora globbae TaxID=1894969 RepID=A0ABZ1S6L0_9ACTN|nr:cryptochrome/photolyase family protein [Micromonospora globbae]WTF85125.1 cryptochrome/photolyase family protein [Micromonospora globbae]